MKYYSNIRKIPDDASLNSLYLVTVFQIYAEYCRYNFEYHDQISFSGRGRTVLSGR